MPGNRIDRIGIELECGILRGRTKLPTDFFRVTSDISISVNNYVQHEAAELVSRPLLKSEVKPALKKAYEVITETNSTMGLHVHLSFKDEADYWVLTQRHFVRYIVKSARRDFPEWIENRFATRWAKPRISLKDIDRQLIAVNKDKSRYRAVNFCKKFHGTVEFRFFKATDDEDEARHFVEWLVDRVEEYLDQPRIQRKKNLRKEVKIDEDMDEIEIDLGDEIYV